MLLTILTSVFFIGLLGLLFIDGFKDCIMNTFWGFPYVFVQIILFVFFLLFLISTIFVQITKDVEYEKMLMERDVIEYRLELVERDELDTYAEIMLYESILNYNKNIIHQRRWSQNIWTSWFYNDLIGNMETVDTVKIGE